MMMVTPGGLEPPAYGLGNRRSILLSYGVTHWERRPGKVDFRFSVRPRDPNKGSDGQEKWPSTFPSGRATHL